MVRLENLHASARTREAPTSTITHHEKRQSSELLPAQPAVVHAQSSPVVAHQLHTRVDPGVQPIGQHARLGADEDTDESAAEDAVAVEVPAGVSVLQLDGCYSTGNWPRWPNFPFPSYPVSFTEHIVATLLAA